MLTPDQLKELKKFTTIWVFNEPFIFEEYVESKNEIYVLDHFCGFDRFCCIGERVFKWISLKKHDAKILECIDKIETGSYDWTMWETYKRKPVGGYYYGTKIV